MILSLHFDMHESLYEDNNFFRLYTRIIEDLKSLIDVFHVSDCTDECTCFTDRV